MQEPHVFEVAQKFSRTPILGIEVVPDGSVNETYVVETEEKKFILQRMSSVFDPKIMDNLSLIGSHISTEELHIPSPLPLQGVGIFTIVEKNGRWWRALSYVPGKTIHNGMTSLMAESAGRLIGRFHGALRDVRDKVFEPIPHFHDTPYVIDRLVSISKSHGDGAKKKTLEPVVEDILERYKQSDYDCSLLPKRIIHADLKISNIRFDKEGNAIGLIDMDTVMQHSIMVEMGDALRSWCQVNGEDEREQVFEREVFEYALNGYLSVATHLTKREKESLTHGVSLVTLELAARFIIDAFEESYFQKHASYANLFEQGYIRAKNQLAFLDAFENSGVA